MPCPFLSLFALLPLLSLVTLPPLPILSCLPPLSLFFPSLLPWHFISLFALLPIFLTALLARVVSFVLSLFTFLSSALLSRPCHLSFSPLFSPFCLPLFSFIASYSYSFFLFSILSCIHLSSLIALFSNLPIRLSLLSFSSFHVFFYYLFYFSSLFCSLFFPLHPIISSLSPQYNRHKIRGIVQLIQFKQPTVWTRPV